MRKYVALIIGVGVLIGGGYLLYSLFFHAERFPFMFVAGGGFLMFIGGHLVVDTLRNWQEEKS